MAKTRFGSLDGIHKIKKLNSANSVLVSAAMFVVIIAIFLACVAKATNGSKDEQKQVLENAIERSMIQCYITEGKYPESFEYLAKNYGIIYDDDMFRVDYISYGTNMKPSVTVISLED